MGVWQDVKRGAKTLATEAEIQTQVALKRAEAANLEGAIREALAEAGREMLRSFEAQPAGALPVSDRAKALFDEAKRLEREVEEVRAEIERLRGQSVFQKREGGGDGGASGAGSSGNEAGRP